MIGPDSDRLDCGFSSIGLRDSRDPPQLVSVGGGSFALGLTSPGDNRQPQAGKQHTAACPGGRGNTLGAPKATCSAPEARAWRVCSPFVPVSRERRGRPRPKGRRRRGAGGIPHAPPAGPPGIPYRSRRPHSHLPCACHVGRAVATNRGWDTQPLLTMWPARIPCGDDMGHQKP